MGDVEVGQRDPNRNRGIFVVQLERDVSGNWTKKTKNQTPPPTTFPHHHHHAHTQASSRPQDNAHARIHRPPSPLCRLYRRCTVGRGKEGVGGEGEGTGGKSGKEK
ncbi:hypothetical protein Pmani_004982 [Petrolisthes manimaculis]|uniref:Uncharacterized protein n=1 Tax=Petrolisthes manimaculis TaxID=1843537 RepID=A0AAE1UL08_9EUCA|nr:hypothetical protein Pmani_004982 [Petrolisthes manimaculis]